ncbi:MAG: hypothetical protein F4160_20055 [Rhodospirillaceae bacterium]|nr:hypothetical protein [Rhodospirillaceae bacterium]MYH39086.1 hypothetical protein [Rhodospirillaceae bacterium]
MEPPVLYRVILCPETTRLTLHRAIYNNEIALQSQCFSIVGKMSKRESEQFTITLPVDAIEMIEQGLIPFGLYGKKRATVCSALILDMLKRPDVQENIEQGRSKARSD